MSGGKVETVTGPSGLPVGRIISGGRTLTLHSTRPLEEAARQASRFNKELDWVVVAGAGYWYLPEYLLKNTDFNIIVYEHDSLILDAARAARDLNDILSDGRIHLVQGPVDELTDFLTKNRVREMAYQVSRVYTELYPDIYSNLDGVLAALLSRRAINQATLRRFQKVWLRNIIRNTPLYFNNPGLSGIVHQFRGRPAVVVGAGPSLPGALEVLRKCQDACCIIATDTSLPMLEAAGIDTDFIVSVDPQDKNAWFLLSARAEKGVLVLEGAGSNQGCRKFGPERTVLFDSIFPLYHELSKFWGLKGSLASGGSVSTNAFDLARYLGADPIIMAGQDLAFTRKAIHAPGNVLEDNLYTRITRFSTYENYHARTLVMADRIEVPRTGGGMVRTDRKFLTFRDWFVREIGATQARVVNATEGGAEIKGALAMSMEKAAGLFCGQPFDKKLELKRPQSPVSAYLDFRNRLMNTLSSLIPLAEKAAVAADRAAVLYRSHQGLERVLEDMAAFDRSFLTAVRSGSGVGRFLELSMQNSIEAIMKEGEQVDEKVMEGWKELYREARDGLLTVRHLMLKQASVFHN